MLSKTIFNTLEELKQFALEHGIPVTFGAYPAPARGGFYWPLAQMELRSPNVYGTFFKVVPENHATELMVDYKAWKCKEAFMGSDTTISASTEDFTAEKLLESLTRLDKETLLKDAKRSDKLPIRISPLLKEVGLKYLPVRYDPHDMLKIPVRCGIRQAEELFVSSEFWENELLPYLRKNGLVDIKI